MAPEDCNSAVSKGDGQPENENVCFDWAWFSLGLSYLVVDMVRGLPIREQFCPSGFWILTHSVQQRWLDREVPSGGQRGVLPPFLARSGRQLRGSMGFLLKHNPEPAGT